jgi:UDP-GlcNAc:undecaprenyl-phosphate GlcNAc-1-phosphate transferase
MTTIGILFVLAALLSMTLTRLMIPLSLRTGIVDRPDGFRKLHDKPTPRLGGVGIYLAFVVSLFILFHAGRWTYVAEVIKDNLAQFRPIVIGASAALLLGVIDDALNLRPRWKLLWQVVIATVSFAAGLRIWAIGNPFGNVVSLGLLSLPLTVLWFVGCMNAVNLLDGLDGLASGACLFVGITLFLVSLETFNLLGMCLMAAFSGAVLGFLVFNFPPARIFLGDSGSMLLGYLIAALSLVGATMKAEAAVALLIPVIAMGLPIIDTALAIVRRWYARSPISMPDRGHIHHVLVKMGYSPRRTVLVLYAISVLLGVAAFLVTMKRSEITVLVIGSLVITVFVTMRIFAGVGPSQVIARLVQNQTSRQKLTDARISLQRAEAAMQTAKDIDGLWLICRDTFPLLGLSCAKLMLSMESTSAGGERQRSWSAAGKDNATSRLGDRMTLHMEISPDGHPLGYLQLENCHCVAADEPVTDTLILLARFRDDLAKHVARIMRQRT